MFHLHKWPVRVLVLTWILAELQGQVDFFIELDAGDISNDVQELSDQADMLQEVEYSVDEVYEN